MASAEHISKPRPTAGEARQTSRTALLSRVAIRERALGGRDEEVEAIVLREIERLDAAIEDATTLGAHGASTTYRERISASRTLPDEVDAIKHLADEVRGAVLKDFQDRGYGMDFLSIELHGNPDSPLTLFEFYDTRFFASW